MKNIVYQITFVLIIIGIIAFFTVPSDRVCKLKASTVVKKYLNKVGDSNSSIEDSLMESVTERAVSSEDKIVYRKINFSYNGGIRTIGFGFFGFVYLEEL